MLAANLSFAGRDWLWPVVFLAILGAILAWRGYSRLGASPRTRALCLFLKLAGLALLLVFLLEPMWTSTRPREGANLFAVVADNSMGLQIHDAGQAKTRGELLRENLTQNSKGWQSRLEDLFMVRRFLFDSHLQASRDFSELNFEGTQTALGFTLKNLKDRFQGQPLAGIILFTDGNATDLENGLPDLTGLPPVYPVVLGEDKPLRDLSIEKVGVTQTVFEDAPVTITANVLSEGFKDEQATASLLLNNKVVAQESIRFDKSSQEIPLRFQVKPEQAGVSFYTLNVALQNSTGTNLLEATLHNNFRVAPVDRGRGPHRILYVSGRPNWEFKFLNRAISEDSQIQLPALIRIAKREPKFTFRGRTGESSNPLFRGFNKVDEETERYDQPVLVRLNTRDDVELRGGFPKTADELYGYDAIILDDLEAEFFTSDQMLLVQKFVAERGGGFLMLGGADSLQDGKYARTPIGDMLPVYLDRLPNQTTVAGWKLELTREGWLQPWIRLRENESGERSRLEALPPYQVLNQLKEIKPGASVLATARGRDGTQYPAVVAQRFGNGRVAALAVGDMWRGGLRDEQSQADLAKGWRQLARWIISDVPNQLDLRVENNSNDQENSISIRVKTRDKNFEPLENAAISLVVEGPSEPGRTNSITLQAAASEKEPGLYSVEYIPRTPGAYHVTGVVTDSTGLKIGSVEGGWASEPLAKEFQSLKPNRALLRDLAGKTGGEVVPMENLESFAGNLDQKKAPIVETFSYPLWHKTPVFLLALACFITEWGVRRWKGLA